MSNISTSEKQDALAEVFKLLMEQELSLSQILTTGENCECAVRAKQINDLLEQLGGASNFGSLTPDTSP